MMNSTSEQIEWAEMGYSHHIDRECRWLKNDEMKTLDGGLYSFERKNARVQPTKTRKNQEKTHIYSVDDSRGEFRRRTQNTKIYTQS